MDKVKVFISYSHKDELWKDRLVSHLRFAERQGIIEIWDASEIPVGTEWEGEITSAINEADIAVLLISADFLASNYIIERELPHLLEMRASEGLVVLPIVVRPSPWSEIPELAQLQFLNTDAQPLSAVSAFEAEDVVNAIAMKIREIAGAITERRAERSQSADKFSTSTGAGGLPGEFFISHSREDGDFAELLKLKLAQNEYSAWIDTDRLLPGLDWRNEIDDAIRNSTALLAIMSPNGKDSEYVTYEWAFAWGAGKPIVPIMLNQTALHPRLATLQYLDFTDRPSRPWTKLYDALRKIK
ncbi:MAG: toll/interleukin-1 receptor domain-containing protein [Candidatus Thiodiazotropha sp.]